jgi:hypothetical protein
MNPVVLLVGRLPHVTDTVAKELEDLPIQWLGAHDRRELEFQLQAEPNIRTVVVDAGLDDQLRGELVPVVARHRPDLCVHFQDHASGEAGFAKFAHRIAEFEVLNRGG